MRTLLPAALLLPLALPSASLCARNTAPAATHAAASPEGAIRTVMDAQAAAWNRGDIDAFMQGYNNAPDTTFVGSKVEHGYAQILARYKARYNSQAAMGTLRFSDLEIRPLGSSYAIVTGRFRLDFQGPAAPASGIFSLVWQKTPQGWKTILDHTSADPHP